MLGPAFWLGVVFCFAVLPVRAVLAGSYDFYVDSGADDDGNGSVDKPFKKIEDAINQAVKGNKIYIKDGEYFTNVTLRKSVKLYGQSSSKTIIDGIVTMGNDTTLDNVTVRRGGIVVKAESKVKIVNSSVIDFGRIGIDIEVGNGSLTVSNCKIHGGKGKGMYIQAGNKVSIFGNEIYDNDEEGIDIRSKVDGTIWENSVYGNGESGIEVILGESNLAIKRNKISRNGSSGIAAQFYGLNPNYGNVYVKENVITSSRNYGIDCLLPQGGKPQFDYWSKTIDLLDNTFEKNNKGNFAKACNLVEDGIDKNDLSKVNETKKTNSNSEDQEDDLTELQDEDKKFLAEKQRLDGVENEIRYLAEEFESEKKLAVERMAQVGGGFGFWLSGISSNDRAFLTACLKKIDDLDEKLELLETEENAPLEEKIKNQLEDFSRFAQEVTSFLEKGENRGVIYRLLSMLGWAHNM